MTEKDKKKVETIEDILKVDTHCFCASEDL
jgi:hypothetical protein